MTICVFLFFIVIMTLKDYVAKAAAFCVSAFSFSFYDQKHILCFACWDFVYSTL